MAERDEPLPAVRRAQRAGASLLKIATTTAQITIREREGTEGHGIKPAC
jgi:hypothetical protein